MMMLPPEVSLMPISRTLLTALAASGALACASGGRPSDPQFDPRYRTSVAVDSAAGARGRAKSAAPVTALPGLTIAPQLSEGGKTVRRIQLLDAGDKDLPVVLKGLAESFGLNYQIDSDVRGTVQTRLEGVTLEQALDAIVLPQGYAYAIENGVLRVGGAKAQTRIFSLDYVALSRFASTNTTVQRRLGNLQSSGGQGFGGNQGGGGFAGGAGGGADQIVSSSVADMWDEIRVALVALVFDTKSTETTGTTANASSSSTGGSGLQGARSFSRVDEDGRKVIINPIAGSIVVAATPAKLAEVATFISAFEASVQRQVLIEAKIVEVALNKESQFGIDWSQVSKINNLNFGIAQTTAPSTGTIALTLGGGGTQINLVLRALQRQGAVSVLSSPRVSALNNMRATFNVTTDEVFFAVTRTPILGPNGGTIGFSPQIIPQPISVGIVLDVLPQISADNTITMNIRPHITSVVRIERIDLPDDGGSATAPVVENRETDTMVRARAGETIVIGGLMQNRLEKTRTGVPLLRDAPLIGGLFRGSSNIENKSELVIFITPTIVVGQPPAGF